MRTWWMGIAVLALGAAAASVQAQDDRRVLQWAASCAACHGTSGRGGSGDVAFGTVGAYGLSIAPASVGPPPSADGTILMPLSAAVTCA